jgi:hypothetical protein
LVSSDTNRAKDIFVHDRLLASTVRVSVSTAGEEGGWEGSGSEFPCITSDGRFVMFRSAGNFVPDDTNDRRDVYAHEYSSDNFWLLLNKSSVAGQNSVLGTVTMLCAPNVNAVYTTYDNSTLVNTPSSVTVLAGQLSRDFQITTMAITSTVTTTIYATRLGLTRSRQLTLTPLIPTAISFTPTDVAGGQPTSCRVVINGVAGPGGRVIAIFDNSPYSTVPSTVTVAPGATSVTFNITTTVVPRIQNVTVTARVSAGEKTGTFRINP